MLLNENSLYGSFTVVVIIILKYHGFGFHDN